MIELFVFSAFFLFLFVLNGSFYMRLCTKSFCKNKETLPNAKSFFIGFIINGIYFEIIHLFLPLTIFTLLPLILIFAYEVFFQFRKNKIVLKNYFCKPSFSLICTVLCTLAFFITFGILYSIKNTSINSYDTYLYHANLVTWYNEYKIVPGLAHLHSRLGMNSLYLFVAGGIDVSIFDKCSAFILPCVFATATFLYFAHQFFSEKSDVKVYSLVMVLWILIFSNKNPSLYYDNSSLALGAIFLLELYKILSKKCDFSVLKVFELCLFAAGNFGIKQMGAFNVLISFVVLGFWCYKNCKSFSQTLKNASFCLILPFILFLAYCATNIIQTGFPLFPLPIAKFDFAWAVPKEVAQGNLEAILYWARAPGAGYMQAKDDFWFWFIPWYKKFVINPIFFLTIFACIAWTYVFIKKINIKVSLCLFAILMINLAYWFISAPGVRFASCLFFEFFAIAFCLIATEKNCKKMLLSVMLCTFLSGYSFDGVFSNIVYNVTSIQGNIRLKRIQKIEPLPCEKYLVPNGQKIPLYVNVPIKGDQTGDAPLPCAPYKPSSNLMLFEEGNLQSGFYLKEN